MSASQASSTRRQVLTAYADLAKQPVPRRAVNCAGAGFLKFDPRTTSRNLRQQDQNCTSGTGRFILYGCSLTSLLRAPSMTAQHPGPFSVYVPHTRPFYTSRVSPLHHRADPTAPPSVVRAPLHAEGLRNGSNIAPLRAQLENI